MAAGLLFCAYYFFAQRTHEESDVKLANPFELGPAIQFGILYAVILVVAKAAQFYFQDTGVYLASVLAGLTDVDAITLSTANLAEAGRIDTDLGWRAIVLATLSNLGFKALLAGVLGGGALLARLLPLFGASAAAGAAVLALWP